MDQWALAPDGDIPSPPMTADKQECHFRRRRSKDRWTSTVDANGKLVPWLAAGGPLNYSPETPPDRDYFFQYSWILPGVFADMINLREHYYFGANRRDAARKLFDFWAEARVGKAIRVAATTGSAASDSVTAPLAAYHTTNWLGDATYVIIQHGSYQLLPVDDQPLLPSHEVLLYRGIGDAEEFHLKRRDEHPADDGEGWRRYLAVQTHVLSDTVRSFNSIHDR